MGDYEEFLAVMVTNMFRSDQSAKTLHKNYVYKELVSERDLEVYLSSKRQYIDALEFFLDDPLVELLVPLNTPFNPFRDFKKLQADYSLIREIVGDVVDRVYEPVRLEKLGQKLSEMQTMSIETSRKAIHGN
jgi:hypothetical protein